MYVFELIRDGEIHEGNGDIWLWYDGAQVHLRIRGVSFSASLGEATITLITDCQAKMLFALTDLEELDEKQCLKYPFPVDNANRQARLLSRLSQVQNWVSNSSTSFVPLSVQWTQKNILDLLVEPDGDILGVDMRRDTRIVKNIMVNGSIEAADAPPADVKTLFGPPPDVGSCKEEEKTPDPLSQLQTLEGQDKRVSGVTAPHGRSSALNDILLAIVQPSLTVRPFITLSVLALPGDIGVIIQDPSPPAFENITTLAFDYNASAFKQGVGHQSNGSVWVKFLPGERHFRLQGEAMQTQVGPIVVNFLADAKPENKVYAYLQLIDQGEKQCVAYDYPEEINNTADTLQVLAEQPLMFLQADQIHGEDCAVFMAPLPRGRWIRVWVDMEEDTHHGIMRVEVLKDEVILRVTDILRWREEANFSESLMPDPAWNCEEDPAAGQLAHYGLHEMHRRSMEMQETLYATKNLAKGFAVLEVLALPGDLAIGIQEPQLPELWQLPGLSFQYAMSVPRETDLQMTGSVTADIAGESLRLHATDDSKTLLSVAVTKDSLAVHIQPRGQPFQCLLFPMNEDNDTLMETVSTVGRFDQVDAIDDIDCDRFTFLATHPGEDDVEFWYSKEDQKGQRFEILKRAPPAGVPTTQKLDAIINISDWQAPKNESLSTVPPEWKCQQASSIQNPWVKFGGSTEEARARCSPLHTPEEFQDQCPVPAAVAAVNLAEALLLLGLLPPAARGKLTRLMVALPGNVPSASKPTTVDMFGPDLKAFSFSFKSTYPLQPTLPEPGSAQGLDVELSGRHIGIGEVRVDLEKRRLYMESEAKNISRGIPHVKSRIIFRGDRGRLYAHTKIEDFEQCWSVRTSEAVPRPPAGTVINPFQAAQHVGDGYSSQDGTTSSKHALFLDAKKRVEDFVDETTALSAIKVDDLRQDVSVGVTVFDWVTAPVEDHYFEPAEDWNCADLRFLDYAETLGHLDLLRVFFPHELSPADKQVGDMPSDGLSGSGGGGIGGD